MKPTHKITFIIFLKPILIEHLSSVLKGLESHEIRGFEGYPPITLSFFESETIESLSLYFRFAQSDGLSIDTDAISSTFLIAKKIRGTRSEDDTRNLWRNTFFHFQTVLKEFEEPASWCPPVINPRYPTLSDNLWVIFERLYEEIDDRSLIWRGELDKELADMIRRFLIAQGFKERK